MANSSKKDTLTVSFDDSGVGFSVTGQGRDLAFKTLAQFHDAVRTEGLKPAVRDAVVDRVIKHFVAQDAEQPLDSHHLPTSLMNVEGVSVTPNRETSTYDVRLPFHQDIVRALHQVPGAEFANDRKLWTVPLEARGALLPALEAAGSILGASVQAHAAILADVATMNFPGDEQIRVTDYHPRNWIDRGEIIAANAHFAAQLTRQAAGDPFVRIHSQSALDRQVFVGDDVGIKYDNRGAATVLDRQQLQSEFAEMTVDKFFSTLGEKIDGVTATKMQDGSMLVEIDHHNARPAAPLHRLDKYLEQGEKIAFQSELGGFVVPASAVTGASSVLAKAVSDGRSEIREDNAARKEISEVAQEKLAGAKVSFVTPKAGEWQEGKILFVNDRYALQSSGREFMKCHSLRSLAQLPVEGQLLKISYQEAGKARVEDRSQARAQEQSRGPRRSA